MTQTTTQDLDRAVQAARGIKPPAEPRWCRVCDEPLVGAQWTVGLCWACQFREEARDRREGA
jgi:hypothetical protein